MKFRHLALASALAIGCVGLAAPGHAQQQDGGSIFGQILDRILGPAPQPTPTPTGTPTPGATPTLAPLTLSDVLADPFRDADRARDTYRHPRETLEFFQVQPGMTVVDYMPNGWWYTRILVPYLGPNGVYIGMNPDVRGMTGYFENTYSNVGQALAAEHAKWADPGDAAVAGFNTQDYSEELDGRVDRVLIFREMHNQLRYGWLHKDMMVIRRMLKPGGMIGLVDHRMYENAPYSMTDGNKGYLRQSDVIALMDVYGFDLVGSSEINANPKDTKDYEVGVWALPPNLVGATRRTRAARLAIGESDRMTLLFRKRD